MATLPDNNNGKYIVEFDGPYYDGGLYEIGRFAMKKDAVAHIQDCIDKSVEPVHRFHSTSDPDNYRIIVEMTFKIKEKK